MIFDRRRIRMGGDDRLLYTADSVPVLLPIKNVYMHSFIAHFFNSSGEVVAVRVITNLEPSIVMFAECRPVRAAWKLAAGKCWSFNIRVYSIWVQLGSL
jgi:hypothetical protein